MNSVSNYFYADSVIFIFFITHTLIVETWFHQILYQREIYPRSIFELYKKFGVPVRIAEAPQVQDYLATFVKTCYPFFEKVRGEFHLDGPHVSHSLIG